MKKLVDYHSLVDSMINEDSYSSRLIYIDEDFIHSDKHVSSLYQGAFAKIPESIMTNKGMSDYKEALCGYLQLKSDHRNEIVFCPHFFAKWLNKDASRSLVHSKIKKLIRWFEEIGLLECLMPRSWEKNCLQWNDATLIRLKIDDYISSDKNKSGRYGFVYYDELDKIMGYEEKNDKKYAGNYSVIKVLGYLRMCIGRRGENSNHIEAYSDYYCNIAEVLDLCENKFSKCVNILRELGIIHTKIRPNTRFNGKVRKGITIFTNFYKRSGGKILASGREYYEAEQKKKIALLKKISSEHNVNSEEESV